MADIDARLAAAVTDLDARTAMLDAAWDMWGHGHDDAADQYHKACVLLDGPPAGWIGIGMLMMPEGWDWTLHSEGSGTFYRPPGPGRLPDDETECVAERLDCCLVLMARAARALGDKDNG